MSLIDNLKAATGKVTPEDEIILEPDWVSESGATCRITISVTDFEAMFPAANGAQTGVALRDALDTKDNVMEGTTKVGEKGYRQYFDQWTTEGIMP